MSQKVPNEVSVIITTSDRPLLFQRALISCLKQKAVSKIIIVDDSTPANKNRNRQIINGIPLIKYIPIDSNNASVSRNLGAKNADSKFCAFLDDDDYWLHGYIESCLLKAQKQSADLVLTGFLEEKNGKLFKEKMPSDSITKDDFLLKNPGLRGSNLFISKKLFDSLNGFDPDLKSHNDLDIGYRLFDKDNISYTINPRYLVVFNNNNGRNRLSRFNSESKREGILKFYLKYENRMSYETKHKFIKRALTFWQVNILNLLSERHDSI